MFEYGTLGYYLGSFILYTVGAIGVIYGIFLYLKKNPNGLPLQFPKKSVHSQQTLRVESVLSLEARKNLYVVCSGQERFLIATSMEGTQLLSRLEPTTALPEAPEGVEPQTKSEGSWTHPLMESVHRFWSLCRLGLQGKTSP